MYDCKKSSLDEKAQVDYKIEKEISNLESSYNNYRIQVSQTEYHDHEVV
jgi:hypothetical protein